jgi:hypothetical protein
MLIVALPLLRVAVGEVYPPAPSDSEAVSVTEPVGVGFPVPPLTEITAESTCAVVTEGGVLIDTFGVVKTVSNCVAVFDTWVKSPEYHAESVCGPTGDKAALKVVDPFDKVFGPPMIVEPSRNSI